MRVVPSLGDWAVGHRVHRRFAARPGAEHIATRRALAYLSAVVSRHPPKAVLEFGAGIGTITYLLLSSSPKLNVVAIEANPFCLAQLERNIPEEFKPRLTIFTKKTAPLDDCFDLIVIDGGLPSTDTYSFLRHGTICFIEGNREQISAKLMQVAQAQNLVFDLEKQPFGSFYMRWPKTHYMRWPKMRLGFSLPVYAPRKTCRIGVLRAAIPIES